MNDEEMDEALRDAFTQVTLREETLRRMVRQAQRAPRSRMPAIVLVLAAAAVLALAAWPLTRAWRASPPDPHPAAVAPLPAPRRIESTRRDPPPARDPVPVSERDDPPAPLPPGPEPPPLDVAGLWVGSTQRGMSVKLVVTGTGGTGFRGKLELQTEGGEFVSASVSGTADAGGFRANGDGVALEATLSGRRANGTITHRGKRVPFSAIR